MRKLMLFVPMLFLLFFSQTEISAQSDFRPGYVILNNGDTLVCDIDYRGDYTMSNICRVRTPDKIINEYRPWDISAFRFQESKYFVSREANGRLVFLEYLVNGMISFYYLRDKDGDHYYIEKEGVPLTELPYSNKLVTENGIMHYKETKTHIGLLKYYTQETPELVSEIEAIREPEPNKLIKLGEDYHNLVCTGEECIVYEKKKQFLSVSPELNLGIASYLGISEPTKPMNYRYGLLLHFWAPRVNEKFYFKTGLIYERLSLNGVYTSYFKYPFHLEYRYPRGKVRPTVSYGVNLYLPNYISVSTVAGTDISIGQAWDLTLTAEAEFYEVGLIIPTELLSISVQIGLKYFMGNHN